MLERSCVEDDARPVLGEDLEHPLLVADVGEDHAVVAEQALARHGDLGGVQCGLVAVEHQQLARAEARNLPAELGADGPAGTRDEHGLALDVLGNGGAVQLDGASTQQISEVQRAETVRICLPEQLQRAREDLDVEPQARCGVMHVLTISASALGMAMATVVASVRVAASARSARVPRTRTPSIRRRRFRGSSSRMPTGCIRAPRSRTSERTTWRPPSPAPMIRTRLWSSAT